MSSGFVGLEFPGCAYKRALLTPPVNLECPAVLFAGRGLHRLRVAWSLASLKSFGATALLLVVRLLKLQSCRAFCIKSACRYVKRRIALVLEQLGCLHDPY